jgi:hypothetical protein
LDIVANVVVAEIFETDKGKEYVTFIDKSAGGLIKMEVSALPHQSEFLGLTGTLKGVVKAINYNGKLSLTLVSGTFTKA